MSVAQLSEGDRRSVHQSNESDNLIQFKPSQFNPKQSEAFGLDDEFCLCQPETFGLGGGLRISQPNPT